MLFGCLEIWYFISCISSNGRVDFCRLDEFLLLGLFLFGCVVVVVGGGDLYMVGVLLMTVDHYVDERVRAGVGGFVYFVHYC